MYIYIFIYIYILHICISSMLGTGMAPVVMGQHVLPRIIILRTMLLNMCAVWMILAIGMGMDWMGG